MPARPPPHFEMESAPAPTAAVILLHGLGASGHDFAGLVPELDLKGCADMRFVLPHAPSMPISVNEGQSMPAWYDIRALDLQREQDAAGIQQSELAVLALVAQQIRRGIAAERIVLAGFSQGAALALHTALRLPYRLAGVLVLSGYLLLPERLRIERSPANANTPIFIGHGLQDTLVPVACGHALHSTLQALGYPVQWHAYEAGHHLTSEEVDDMAAFLRQVLPA